MEAARRTPVSERSNLAHWFAGRVHQVLDYVMGSPAAGDIASGGQGSGTAPTVCVASLSPAHTAEAVVEVDQAIARMQGVRAALLAHADTVDVAAECGASRPRPGTPTPPRPPAVRRTGP